MINKKGSTFTNWLFVIMGVAVFIIIFQASVLDEMNNLYGKNYNMGLSDDARNITGKVNSLMSSSRTQLEEGEVSTVSSNTGFWLNIVPTAKAIFSTLADFASGNFLRAIMVDKLGFPEIVPSVIIILIWASLVFIMIRIIIGGVTP